MKEIKALMFVNIFCVSAMMAFLAVAGPVVRGLGLQEWHAGLTVALAGVAWIIFSRFWGRKSDVIGRKRVLVISVGGFAISYFLFSTYIDFGLRVQPAIMVSLSALIVTRIAIGLFFSAIQPVSAAMVADKIEPAERASYMAKLGAANGLGMILGPAYGGMLAVYGLSIPLYVSVVLPVIAVAVVLRGLETNPDRKENKTEMLKLTDKRLFTPMAAAFLTMYSVVTCQICTGFYAMDKLGYDPVRASEITGYTLSSVGITMVAIQIVVVKFKSVLPSTWLRLGSLLAGIGLFAVSTSVNFPVLLVGFVVSSSGMGMIFPAFQAITANSVNQDEQGAAAGTVSAAQGVGIIIGPLASTAIYGFSPSLSYVVASLAFAFLFVIALRYKSPLIDKA